MGWIEKFAQYGVQRGVALENAIKDARAKLQAGNYTADDYVQGSLKLWVDGVDGWFDLFPYSTIDPTPTLYAFLGASATSHTFPVPVAPPPGGFPAKLTGLIALAGTGAGSVTATAQADGRLKFSVSALSGLAVGDLYESICFYDDAAGKRHLLVVLRITIA